MTACKIYASKIDGWLVVLSLAGGVAMLTTLLSAPHSGSAALRVSILSLASMTLGSLAWVILGTYYRFDGPMLLICSGPFRWRIPIREIVSVTPSRSSRSGPALSLDRLAVEYGTPRRLILISPRDRGGFMQEFERRRGH